MLMMNFGNILAVKNINHKLLRHHVMTAMLTPLLMTTTLLHKLPQNPQMKLRTQYHN